VFSVIRAKPGYLHILLGGLWIPMIAGAAESKPRDGRLEAALAAWEKSAAALQSYDLFLRVDTTNLTEQPKVAPKDRRSSEELARAEPRFLPPGTKPPVITDFSRQVLSKQGKRRFENLDPKGDNWTNAKVFDGKVVRWLSLKGKTGGVSDAGPDKASFASYYNDYGALYRDLSGGGTIVWLLRSRHGASIVEGREGERNYVVIESPPEEGDYYPKLELKIDLDPNHGMMPAEIDSGFRSSDQTRFWRITIEKFHEIQPGVWAPVQATYRWGPPGKVFSIINVAVDMARSQWNKPVSEDLFTLAYPVGTRVVDFSRPGGRPIVNGKEIERPPANLSFAQRYQRALRDCRLAHFGLMVILFQLDDDTSKFVDVHLKSYETTHEACRFIQLPGETGPELAGEIALFAKAKNWPMPAQGRVFACAIDASGKEVARIELDCKDPKSPQLAAEFIRKHARGAEDASKKWDEAFAEAKRTHRKVWARICERYCGPCFLLTRWLDDHKDVLAKDYVFLTIDDWDDLHGEEVARRLTGDGHYGIPFFAIYDGDGRMLINSVSPTGNVGFPSEVEGQRHLRRMLVQTSSTITAEQINALIARVKE